MNRTVVPIFFFLILATSCKKDNGTPAFTSSSYPLAVGNFWQYQLTSFYGTDTFILSVVSSVKVGPYMQYNCNFIGSGGSGPAGYFLLADTAMSFINTTSDPYNTPFPNFHFKFPVEAGQKWPGAFPGDTTVVVAVVSSENFYGHTYGPCYITTESYDLPHNFKDETMTLSPQIGMIQQSITFDSDTAGKTATYSGGVQIQQQISLISYHVQ